MDQRVLIKIAAAVTVAGALALSTVSTASAAGVATAPAPPAAASADANRGGGRDGVTPNSKLGEVGLDVDESKNKIVATLRGVGKQVYDCVGTAYSLREPVATLATLRGEPAGIHGAGPFWASFDGSKVIGNTDPDPKTNPLFKSVPPPKGNPPGVNWLRVPTKTTAGQGGVFSNVTFIQRIDTRGGLAPTGTCTKTVAVDYSTNYVFWGPK